MTKWSKKPRNLTQRYYCQNYHSQNNTGSTGATTRKELVDSRILDENCEEEDELHNERSNSPEYNRN